MKRWFGLAALVAILLGLVIGYLLKQESLSKQLNRELELLRQSGEPVTLADLLPPVPPNEDGTPFYRLAIAQLETAKKRLSRTVWDSVYEFISRQPSKPVRLSDVQLALQAAQPALKTLRQALKYPHMRLTNWNEENPWSTLFPHFLSFREFARLLLAEGLWRKRQGDIDGAVESHLTMLKLVQRISDEPTFIGFLLQASIFSTSLNGLQQILEDADPSSQTYRAVIEELRSWDIDKSFVRALQAERVVFIAFCEWARKSASRREINELSPEKESFVVNIPVWLGSKSALAVRNQLLGLQYYKSLLAVARKGVPYKPEELKSLENQWRQLFGRNEYEVKIGIMRLVWDSKFIAKEAILPFSMEMSNKVATQHALQRLAIVACALRLYKKEHGRYPETLRALVPKYLPTVPVDPFDGKVLRYQRVGEGFKVWSIGEDLKDDGGVEGKPRWANGDIVWKAVK